MLEKVELNQKEEMALSRSQLLTLYGNVKEINVLKNVWKKSERVIWNKKKLMEIEVP